jgi:hypothetical protein
VQQEYAGAAGNWQQQSRASCSSSSSRKRAKAPTLAEIEAELQQEIEQRQQNPSQWGQFPHCGLHGCSSSHVPARPRQQQQQQPTAGQHHIMQLTCSSKIPTWMLILTVCSLRKVPQMQMQRTL